RFFRSSRLWALTIDTHGGASWFHPYPVEMTAIARKALIPRVLSLDHHAQGLTPLATTSRCIRPGTDPTRGPDARREPEPCALRADAPRSGVDRPRAGAGATPRVRGRAAVGRLRRPAANARARHARRGVR